MLSETANSQRDGGHTQQEQMFTWMHKHRHATSRTIHTQKDKETVQMDIIPKFKVEILVFIYSVNVWKKWSLHALLHQGQ